MIKTCSKCKQVKSILEFPLKYIRQQKRILKSHCTKCEYLRTSKKRRNKRQDIKEKAVELLGGQCSVCGYNRCISALDFHHLVSRQKDFSISRGTLNFDKIKVELKKCVLVCANCHREIHSGLSVDHMKTKDHHLSFSS